MTNDPGVAALVGNRATLDTEGPSNVVDVQPPSNTQCIMQVALHRSLEAGSPQSIGMPSATGLEPDMGIASAKWPGPASCMGIGGDEPWASHSARGPTKASWANERRRRDAVTRRYERMRENECDRRVVSAASPCFLSCASAVEYARRERRHLRQGFRGQGAHGQRPGRHVPRRPPFLALVGGFCGCRGLGMCAFSPVTSGFAPAVGRLREKSGMLLFFIGPPESSAGAEMLDEYSHTYSTAHVIKVA